MCILNAETDLSVCLALTLDMLGGITPLPNLVVEVEST